MVDRLISFRVPTPQIPSLFCILMEFVAGGWWGGGIFSDWKSFPVVLQLLLTVLKVRLLNCRFSLLRKIYSFLEINIQFILEVVSSPAVAVRKERRGAVQEFGSIAKG